MYIASESQLIDLADAAEIFTNPQSRERSILSLTGCSMSEEHNLLDYKKPATTNPFTLKPKPRKLTNYV